MARTLTLAVVGLLVVAALFWNAAEAHYQGCVAAVQALPDTRTQLERDSSGESSYVDDVRSRIDGCSRLP